MNEEIILTILPVVTGAAGVLLTKAYDKYSKSKDPSNKAQTLKQMYDTLEEVYAQDIDLQKRLNLLAKENEQLKQLIQQLKDEHAS